MLIHSRPKLCITSPWNYPLFNPENQTHFGGWEVRIALIARELARRGKFKVSLVVGDHGQPHIEKRHGVTLYSWTGRTIWGIPPVPEGTGDPPGVLQRLSGWASDFARKRRHLDPVTGQVGPYVIQPEAVSIYDEMDADLYMVPGNSQFSTDVAFYARQRGRKYVFLAGSDMDYYPEYKLHPDQLDMYSVPFALKTFAIENADAHIVQNERQAEMLKAGYGREGRIIKNPLDLTLLFPPNPQARTILWVGKSDERVKRPSLAFELARRLPGFEFMLVMNLGLPETHSQCLEAAACLPNVTLVERIPFEQIEQYFANACLHINTSSFEGFPNTFLQAAKYTVPTLSLQVDPGGMLSQHGAGLAFAGDLDAMTDSLRALMTDPVRRSALGQKALAYVRTVHDKDVVMPQYEQALFAALENAQRS